MKRRHRLLRWRRAVRATVLRWSALCAPFFERIREAFARMAAARRRRRDLQLRTAASQYASRSVASVEPLGYHAISITFPGNSTNPDPSLIRDAIQRHRYGA
jgi:hypothetical protein